MRLVGPLCTPLDTLNPDLDISSAVARGDLLRIPNVGAYGLTASLLAFLGHECPVEVTVGAGAIREVTRIKYAYALNEANHTMADRTPL